MPGTVEDKNITHVDPKMDIMKSTQGTLRAINKARARITAVMVRRMPNVLVSATTVPSNLLASMVRNGVNIKGVLKSKTMLNRLWAIYKNDLPGLFRTS